MTTTKPKLSTEEFIKRKQQLAGEPGTYVVKSNTLESKYMLVRLREYDRLLAWVKTHIGVDIETQDALSLIEQCRNVEKQFEETLAKLKEFVTANTKKATAADSGDNGRTKDTN